MPPLSGPTGGGGATPWQADRVIFLDTATYPTIQDAVDAAELLAGADDLQGIMVVLPPQDFSTEDVVIKKNIFLVGLSDPKQTLIGSVTFRPTSALAAPGIAGLRNLSVETIAAKNETAESSGVFNTNMFEQGLKVDSCEITGLVDLNRIKVAEFNYCPSLNSTFKVTYCTSVTLQFCKGAGVQNFADVEAANIPDDYADAGGTLNMYSCYFFGLEQTTDGGEITVYANCQQSRFEEVTLNGDTETRLDSTAVHAFVFNNSNNLLDGANSHGLYTPSVDSDWDTVPKFISEAIDQLAARVTVLEP